MTAISKMIVRPGDVVLPGDVVSEISSLSSKIKIILGPGLKRDSDKVFTCKAGVLQKREPNTFWVDNHQKRYVPARGENVVGVVVQKSGDIFKVDIGASEPASLSYLAFENATKKNRPDVQIGDAIFAKLMVANKDMEPEVVCIDSHGKKGKLGVLSNGFVFTCSLNLVRKILNKKCPLLTLLAREIPFEVAVGMNGKVWINARNTRETIAIGNAILATEFVTDEEIKKMCNNVSGLLAGFF